MADGRAIGAVHDWSVGNCDPSDLLKVKVGPPGADHQDALILWMGPAETIAEAEGAALRAAVIAWHVGGALTGRLQSGFPEGIVATSVEFDDDALTPGLSLMKAFANLLGAKPPKLEGDIAAAGSAILRAAAARAVLPPTGSVVIACGSEFDDPHALDDDHLENGIVITDGEWTSQAYATGVLLDAVTALSVAGHLCRTPGDDGPPRPRLTIPESATLRATLPRILRAEANGHVDTAMAFLRQVGLAGTARAFADAYRPQAA